MQINIAYCVTREYMKFASISAASILKKANYSDWYVFYIVCNEFTPETQQLFLRLDKIKKSTYIFVKFPQELIPNPEKFKDRGVSGLYRIFLGEILKHTDKVLYLDTDTIIHSDLAYLYKYDISDYYLGAVQDKYETTMRKHLRLKKNQLFINSGVLLINLAKFREEGLAKRIFKHLQQSKLKNDQSSINAICKDRILYLPIKYNVMMYPPEYQNSPVLYEKYREEFLDAIEYPVIHHMIFKPWEGDYQYLTTSKEWNTVKDSIKEL